MNSFLKRILLNKIQKIRVPYGIEQPDWAKDFLKKAPLIQKEWKDYLVNFGPGRQFDEISKDQIELNRDKKWEVVIVYGYSFFNQKELNHFPTLAELIKKHSSHLTLAMFSTTRAGKTIPQHHGNNHGVNRIQIGIDIADPDNCFLRVEDKKIFLKEKKMTIFDDTFEHELVNKSKHDRTVLIIDFYKKLPLFYHLINKRMNTEIGESDYAQSVFKKIKG